MLFTLFIVCWFSAAMFYVYQLRGDARYQSFSQYLRKSWPIFAPFNCVLYLFTKRKAQGAYIDPAQYKNLHLIQQNYPVILAEAKALVRLLRGIPAKINLIPFNPWPGTNYQCSDWETIEKFADFINQAGYASPIRTPRGRDILAACGQLKSESERMRKTERLAFEAMMIANHGEDDD